MQLETIRRGFSMAGLFLRKYAPQILVGTGLAAGVGATVLAIKGTLKAPKVIEDAKEQLEAIEDSFIPAEDLSIAPDDEATETSIEAYQKQKMTAISKVYFDTALELLKLYGPTLALTGASIGCVLSALKILNTRNAALICALSAVETAYSKYREQVATEFGHEKDLDILDRAKAKALKEAERVGREIMLENTDIAEDVAAGIPFSSYARWFDKENSGQWTPDIWYNRRFLEGIERNMNDILKRRGWLMLNEVYERLGFEQTDYGQLVGWIYKKDKDRQNDGYVSFGLDSRILRDDYRGRDATDYYLDFNVDGVMFRFIGK